MGLVEGDVIAGRFEILRVAGRGGMATVFRARDRRTREDVALKILHATILEADAHPRRASLADPSQAWRAEPRPAGGVIARFQREAEVLASLNEPSIVRYVAHGTTDRREPFLAMQWLEGEDLASRLERGTLAPEEAVAIIARAATALAALHARRVVHRDVKPANLFLPAADPRAAVLLDLGIAHVPKRDARLTTVGMIMGTPEYMSPEQARGDLEVTARSDVFSLGAVLFECVAGRPPFAASHLVAVLAKIVFEEAPRLGAVADRVHPALDGLVSRMLEKDPLGRPADGGAVLRELQAVRELAPPRSSRRSAPRARAIGSSEQRIISVIAVTDRAARALVTSDTLLAESFETPPSVELSRRMHLLGGKLERLANGAYVVTVASPASAIEQAARAATCALALRAALRDPHIALATGRGVLGERLPVGDAIDRAVAMLSELRAEALDDGSEPLPVAIDAVTAALARSRFVVRGTAERRTLHGPLPRAIASRTILGRPSPWVGRDAELGALVRAYERVASARVPEAHLVVGASGIGKSRLGDELARRLATRTDARVICASGDPTRAGSPLEMLSQALRFAVGAGLGDPRSQRRSKLERRVAAVVDPSERARVVAFLAPLLAASELSDADHAGARAALDDPRFMSDEILRALTDYLAAEAARAPVAIVFDDLQWTDPATLAFLAAALAALDRSPILVVALARPEIDRTFPRPFASFSTTRVDLAELPRAASERLVRSALGRSATEASIADIVERAGGNPFLLEELVRAAAESSRELLPQTVLAVVQSRLEAFPAEARRALRAASLFGRVATVEGVAAVLDVDVDRARHHLEMLSEADVLARSDDGHRVVYAFRQATTRDAAYEMLTSEDKKLGHAIVAKLLEDEDAIDPLSVGRHYQRGGDCSRALLWYRRAAMSALEASDLEGAIHIAQLAEACGATGADLGALRAVMAEAALWLADYPAARAYAAEALDLLEPGTRPWLLALGNAVRTADKLGERTQVGALLATLLRAQATPATAPAFADVLAQAAVSLVLSGQAALADTLLLRADELARDLADHPRVEGRLFAARAFRASVAGEPERYFQFMTGAARAFERGGDIRSACVAYGNSGHGAALLGSYEDAVQILQSALGLAQRHSFRNAAGWMLHNLGAALGGVGQYEEGVATERRAVESARVQRDSRLLVASLTALASLLASGNEHETAAVVAQEAVNTAEEGSPQKAIALAAHSRAALGLGDSRRALEAAIEAVSILSRLARIEEGELEIWLRYAEALAGEGRREEARVALDRAARRLRELASSIRSPRLRDSYLRRVLEHATILDLERHGVG